jgi:hypothetical protein
MADQARLILDPRATAELVERGAEFAGWSKVMEDPGDGDQPHRIAWDGPWPGLQVYYVDDHNIRVPYLIITGPDSEQATEEVMESLPSYSIDTMLADALEAADGEAKKTSIRRLAVLGAATETDPNILAIFDAAFLDPDPAVRRLAAGATTYPAWREFEPRLELLAEKDTDESVRERAAGALAALREHHWS